MKQLCIKAVLKITQNDKIIAEIPCAGWIPKNLEDCIEKAKHLTYRIVNINLTTEDMKQSQVEIERLHNIWLEITGNESSPFSNLFILEQLVEA